MIDAFEANNDNTADHPQWTVKDWNAEGARRFGDRTRYWAFVCPGCGNVATCDDFQDLGVNYERAAYECIGRVLNERGADPKHKPGSDSEYCDWAAFGLFGGPVSVLVDDPVGDGPPKIQHAFRFAEPDQQGAQ